ncbi:MAG: polymer-forming cytoskeletal protein [Acidobacteria bacterium]|nr:polymer-forming cytoskeletal protein [Acidobacteriota bacterium]MCA1637263.1 polymer-forming cytoskeletal protein [Acidobacteriota bacterium]
MIRMGRSSRTEQSGDANNSQIQSSNSKSLYPGSGNNQSSSRIVSESESMARDIKEGRLSGFVGSGTILTGETTFHAVLRVDGHLTGRVSSEGGTLIIGPTGRVDANILVAAAIINGMVNGDIVATEKLQLGSTAQILGNIQAPRLIIEDGALLEGSCSMIKPREALEQRNIEANSQTEADEVSPYETSETEESNSYFEPVEEENEETEAR